MNRLKIVVPGAAWSDVFLDDAEKPLIPGAPRLMRSQKGPAVVHLLFPSYLSKQRGEVHFFFNKQYGKLSVRISKAFHDRFIIIDDQDYYHFGASIKDLGRRGFMFSRIEEREIIEALKKKVQEEWTKACVEI